MGSAKRRIVGFLNKRGKIAAIGFWIADGRGLLPFGDGFRVFMGKKSGLIMRREVILTLWCS